MNDAPLPHKATRADFARISKRDPAWISRLERAGRLVIDPATDMILVAESLEAIEATAGGRFDVQERHRQQREAQAPHSPPRDAERVAQIRRERAEVDLRIKRLQAEREDVELARSLGELVNKADAVFAMRALGAIVRTEVELLPDRLAPVVAGLQDLESVREELERECRQLLYRVADAMKREDAELERRNNAAPAAHDR